jgi:hypothetical protein
MAPGPHGTERAPGDLTGGAFSCSLLWWELTEDPVVDPGMLMCKPVAEVFAACTGPAFTTKLWVTNSTAPHLARGRWT